MTTNAFWIAASAMNAQSTAFGAIADNIANINTGGYRRKDVEFATLVGAHDSYAAKDSAAKPVVHTRVEADGNYLTTRRDLDAAVTGRGLFVVAENSPTGTQVYTRAGAFNTVADTGGYNNLAVNGKYFLQGWPVSAAGAVSKTLQAVRVPGPTIAEPAVATTAMTLGDNVPATASVGQTHATSLTAIDSTGAENALTFTYANTATNTWTITASSADGAATIGGGAPSVSVTFDPSTGRPTGTASFTVDMAWNSGASGAIAVDFSNATQWSDVFGPGRNTQNGAAAGLADRVFFDSEGFVNAHFSNGQTRQLYKIPSAVFRNADALKEQAGGVFRQSDESGAATLVDPNATARADFLAGVLEGSNVDLADQFTRMIVTQKAYNSAATALRTIDQMIVVAGDLKR